MKIDALKTHLASKSRVSGFNPEGLERPGAILPTGFTQGY